MNDQRLVPVADLAKKFRTLEDRINFCREVNWYWPKLPGFDMKFFLLVLQSRKKLLPLGLGVGFNFRYFTKSQQFTKRHLYSFFANDPELRLYLPDDIALSSLNRNYMMSVLAYARKNVWLQLYQDYKTILSQTSFSRWTSYGIKLDPAVIEKIGNFVSSNAPKNGKFFRVSKKGVPSPSIIPMNNPQGANNAGALNAGNLQGANNAIRPEAGNQGNAMNMMNQNNFNVLNLPISDDEEQI